MWFSKACRAVTIAAFIALAASCSAFERGDIKVRPHIRRSEPTLLPDTSAHRPPGFDTGSVGTAIPSRSTAVRRVCRTDSWSKDWIAIAYERAGGECPRDRDDAAFAAIIVRLDAQQRGATLDICADQLVPNGWEIVRMEGTEVSQRCPGAGPDGASAIRRIRRVA